MATQVGKRYVCTKCGAEYIVTRSRQGHPFLLRAADGA